jgi:hypothetical protein
MRVLLAFREETAALIDVLVRLEGGYARSGRQCFRYPHLLTPELSDD